MTYLHVRRGLGTFTLYMQGGSVRRVKQASLVREPVQVYLDAPDLDLLSRLGIQTGLAKAELLRRGLRRLATDELTAKKPGWSFDVLIGALGKGEPPDLAEHHDDYLYGSPARAGKRGRSRSR